MTRSEHMLQELKDPEPIYCTMCGGIKYHPLARMFSPIQIAGLRCRCNDIHIRNAPQTIVYNINVSNKVTLEGQRIINELLKEIKSWQES